MRVRVYGGDGVEDLGLGTYNENVTIYGFCDTNGALLSKHMAEENWTPDELKAIIANGGIPFEQENNPRIVLDSGRIVYGCQVWWEEYKE